MIFVDICNKHNTYVSCNTHLTYTRHPERRAAHPRPVGVLEHVPLARCEGEKVHWSASQGIRITSFHRTAPPKPRPWPWPWNLVKIWDDDQNLKTEPPSPKWNSRKRPSTNGIKWLAKAQQPQISPQISCVDLTRGDDHPENLHRRTCKVAWKLRCN